MLFITSYVNGPTDNKRLQHGKQSVNGYNDNNNNNNNNNNNDTKLQTEFSHYKQVNV